MKEEVDVVLNFSSWIPWEQLTFCNQLSNLRKFQMLFKKKQPPETLTDITGGFRYSTRNYKVKYRQTQ